MNARQEGSSCLPVFALCFATVSTVLSGCREADGNNAGGGLAVVNLIPSTAGAHGCSGPDQVFSGVCAPCTAPVPVATLVLGPESQITASAATEVLYATGQAGQVVQLDVSGVGVVETEILAPGELDTFLTGIGGATPGALSGVCVLPNFDLVVVEHANNMLLSVDLAVPGTIGVFAGQPDPVGGFADGAALVTPHARFRFDTPVALAATSDLPPIVVVPDSGNHALRFVQGAGVFTVAGTGAPFFGDGQGGAIGFDTPVSVTLRCAGRVLVTESGAAGMGGHRVRELALGLNPFFGDLISDVATVFGDGAPATVGGVGAMGSAFAPSSVLATSEGDVYWIDSGTGILRRQVDTGDGDCPLFLDCARAVSAGGSFTPGGAHSLTQTAAGRLFVADYDPGAGPGTLYEVTP